MKYICHFPNCSYSSDHKSKIDFHHLTPREVKKSKLTLSFCKNHHNLIFHPESTSGQHAINTKESIQILNIFESTDGKVLHYQDFNNKMFYYFFKNKSIIETS